MSEIDDAPLIKQAVDYVESWRRLGELIGEAHSPDLSAEDDSELHALIDLFDDPPVWEPSLGPADVREALMQALQRHRAWLDASFGETGDPEEALSAYHRAMTHLGEVLSVHGYGVA